MNKKLKSLAIGTGLALGMGILSSPAMALSWFQPITAFEDDNIDYVFDNDGSGTLTVGDRLVSVVEWNNTQGVLAGQGPNPIGPGQELTGVADITITGAIPTGGGEFQYVFGASGAAGVLSGFAAGTAVAIFLDNTPDLNVINATCGTRANCMTLAGLGGADGSSVFLTAGFFGDLDALWISNSVAGGATIATVEGGNASTKFASFNFSLDLGINNTGKTIADHSCAPFCGIGGDGLIEITGSGDILGGQFLDHTQWTARSDADYQVTPVPEPEGMALLGLGLLAVFGLRRRRHANLA